MSTNASILPKKTGLRPEPRPCRPGERVPYTGDTVRFRGSDGPAFCASVALRSQGRLIPLSVRTPRGAAEATAEPRTRPPPGDTPRGRQRAVQRPAVPDFPPWPRHPPGTCTPGRQAGKPTRPRCAPTHRCVRGSDGPSFCASVALRSRGHPSPLSIGSPAVAKHLPTGEKGHLQAIQRWPQPGGHPPRHPAEHFLKIVCDPRACRDWRTISRKSPAGTPP